MQMVKRSGVCPKTAPEDWPRILMFAHSRGYLYTNKDASAFALVYRIPEWNEKWPDIMPERESGDKAYCVFAVSESQDKLSLLRMFRGFMRLHNVKTMYYHRRGSDTDLKVIDLGRNYGKVKVA